MRSPRLPRVDRPAEEAPTSHLPHYAGGCGAIVRKPSLTSSGHCTKAEGFAARHCDPQLAHVVPATDEPRVHPCKRALVPLGFTTACGVAKDLGQRAISRVSAHRKTLRQLDR